MRSGLACALAFLLLLVLLGCGGGDEPGRVEPAAVAALPTPTEAWVYVPAATATPWPTFTPVPTPTLTPTPALVPTWTPAPTRAPTPVPSPKPTVEPTSVPVVLPAEEPGEVLEPPPTGARAPTPTPYGKIWRGEFFFELQTFFPVQVDEVPQYLNDGAWEMLPEPSEFVSRFSKFLYWVVVFDPSEADDDFLMDGFIRWTDVTPGRDSLVMLERGVELSKSMPFFFTGLGRKTPGLWQPGQYRVDLLDDRYEPVVGWAFEVR